MAKYFSGITINGDKYNVSIIDDNLNIIFMDNLEISKLSDLFKRKSVTVISLDFPLALFLKNSPPVQSRDPNIVIVKKRTFDNMLNSRNLFTYNDRFSISKHNLNLLIELSKQLNTLGFFFRKPGELEKSIIESYPDTSFNVLGCTLGARNKGDEVLRKKIETLKSKGIRIKDYVKKNRKHAEIEVNTLCQAYSAYLYYKGEGTCFGTPEEGLLAVPSKTSFNKLKVIKDPRKLKPSASIRFEKNSRNDEMKTEHTVSSNNRIKLNNKVIAEYCGAQYLYTNTDGIIRINELRPIKSYRPFTEIYEINHIRSVRVTIGTTDGLRKVKANLIPNLENSNSFRAAEEEDKKKLDSFWGNHGDKRGYLIKFNRVEVVEA